MFDAAAIDAWVGAEVKRRGAVGAALVVVRDGKTVLARGYGVREVGKHQPIDVDTPFAIGSVSKQFACATALTLVDDGKLAMSDRVAKYYPKLTAANDITLADLGGHIAGYRDYYPLNYADQRMLSPIAPDDLIARYASMPLDFPQRTRWSYSNTGYVLLARVLERVSGKSYGTLLEERIFKPLGMRASLARPANAATGHDSFLLGAARPATPEAAGWLFGAGDIFASANDLALWAIAFNDGKILSSAARRALVHPVELRNALSTGYSCGFRLRNVGAEVALVHSGAAVGFTAYNAIAPGSRSSVILLVNDERVDLADLFQKVLQLTLTGLTAIPPIDGPPPAEAARALLLQLQRGSLDRSTLADDLDGYFDDQRLAAAAARLRALGDPVVTLVSRGERGGWEFSILDVAFSKTKATATMFRSPDGKIHQLQLTQ